MLNNISWGSYLSAITFLLLVYYIIIGAKFYSDEIKALLSGKSRLYFGSASSNTSIQNNEEPAIESTPAQPELFASYGKYVPSTEDECQDETIEKVQELTQNLKNVISEAVEKNYIKEEFFLSLELLLKKYSFLKGSPSLAAINNLIASECEKYGYLELSAEERVMLWNE